MVTIIITTEIADGFITEFQKVGTKLNEEGKEEAKYEYVENRFKPKNKVVEIYKQQFESIDIQEVILAVNQPHVINRTGKSTSTQVSSLPDA